MIGPKTFTNYSFQLGVWATILFGAGMAVVGSADLLFRLDWGFTPRDVLMAVVVSVGAVVVKLIGTKIIISFSRGV